MLHEDSICAIVDTIKVLSVICAPLAVMSCFVILYLLSRSVLMTASIVAFLYVFAPEARKKETRVRRWLIASMSLVILLSMVTWLIDWMRRIYVPLSPRVLIALWVPNLLLPCVPPRWKSHIRIGEALILELALIGFLPWVKWSFPLAPALETVSNTAIALGVGLLYLQRRQQHLQRRQQPVLLSDTVLRQRYIVYYSRSRAKTWEYSKGLIALFVISILLAYVVHHRAGSPTESAVKHQRSARAAT
jgi:hypothetical protein